MKIMSLSRQHRRDLLSTVLVVAVLAAGGFVCWYRVTYNVLPGQGASTRVHWCGRDYERLGGTSTWAQLTAQEPGPVRLAGRYPPLGSRTALYAAVVPASQRTPDGGACATGVYLRTGPDRYRGYTLEGGP
jgi:hypothetical protein